MTGAITVTRITHSCVLLDFNGTIILTDPWFSEKRGYYRGERLAMTPDKLPPLDGVVVSHDHYDHYDMAAFQAYSDKQVPFIVKRGIAGKARKFGFNNITEVDAWESAQLGPVKVTAAPAKHGVPEVSFIFEAFGQTIYFGADTLFIPELFEVAGRYPQIVLALLPVNGLAIRPIFNKQVVMSAEEAAQLTATLKPKIVVPIHYSFTGGPLGDKLLLKYNGNATTFEQYVARYAPFTQTRILEPGEPLALPLAATLAAS